MTMRHLFSMSVVLLLGACSTTSTKLLVQRAPQISFKGMTTVGLSVSGECMEIMRGPEKSSRPPSQDPQPLIGISFGDKIPLAERQYTCPDPTFLAQVQSSIETMLRDRLTAQKYKVGPASSGEPGLHMHLKLTRLRESSALFDRKDREGDTTCQKTCGSAACKEYRFVGQLQFEANIDGPELPGIGAQRTALRETFNAIRLHPNTLAGGALLEQNWGSTSGIDSVVTCNEDGARVYLQDNSHFTWDRGRSIMVAWLDKQFPPMLAPYTEEFKLALFKVKGSADNESGLKAAKDNDFYQAFQAFRAAQTKDGQDSERAQLLYNTAAAKMQLGEFRAAQDFLEQSLAIAATDEARALRKELARRISDEAKM